MLSTVDANPSGFHCVRGRYLGERIGILYQLGLLIRRDAERWSELPNQRREIMHSRSIDVKRIVLHHILLGSGNESLRVGDVVSVTGRRRLR